MQSSCNSCYWCDVFTAIGTVGATATALIPTIKENYRRFWVKIINVLVMPITSNFDGAKCDEPRKLCVTIRNRQSFDIGIQMAYVKIYKRRKSLFSCRCSPLRICFGTRERCPKDGVKRNETNTYFLPYNNDCLMDCEKELHEHGIPDKKDIAKISIELYTTVNVFRFKVRKKHWGNITAGLVNYSFPRYKNTP